MSQLDDISDWLRTAATNVAHFKRSSGRNAAMAGWGQFLSNNIHGNQIGPYGTCAAILLSEIADPQAQIEQPVIDQLKYFWDQGEGSKLHEQNIRLAFLVFSLSRSTAQQLVDIRSEAIRLLKSRQLPNGAWPDAALRQANENATPRLDVTAWVALALCEVDQFDTNAKRGAEYILKATTGAQHAANLPAICVAGVLNILSRERANQYVVARALTLVARHYTDSDYQISFFDYHKGGQAGTLSRDYLCSPTILAVSFVLKGLVKRKSPWNAIRLSLAKREMTSTLLQLTSRGPLFKVPEARFATTMDQALVAITYINLRNLELQAPKLSAFVINLKQWFANSIVLSVLLPILLLITAMTTFQSPTNIPELLQALSGKEFPATMEWFKSWSSVLQWICGAILLFSTQIPKVFLDATKKWILK